MSEPKQMFRVTIVETLERTVVVETGDELEAEQMASDAWRRGEYILDADDFTGVEFEVERREF